MSFRRFTSTALATLALSAATACASDPAPPPATAAAAPSWGAPASTDERTGVAMEQGTGSPVDLAPARTMSAEPSTTAAQGAHADGQDAPAAAAPASTATADALAAAMNEGEMVGAAEAINDRAIRLGQLGEGKAASNQVKRFAHDVVTGHESLQSELKDLTAKLHVTPVEGAEGTARTWLKADGSGGIGGMLVTRGPDFDRLYLAAQAHSQARALKLLDSLASHATTPDLQQAFQHMRAKVEVFQHEASSLQESLPRPTGGQK